MNNSVNLDNLREMTGGDAALENELFQVFIDSSEKCLTTMKESCAAGAEDIWRTQAHAWKGMNLNLGAETLGKLCSTAQEKFMANEEEKKKLLAAIIQEYEQVKICLSGGK